MMESLQLPYWMEETITSSPTAYQHEELQLFDNFAETTETNDFLLSNDTLLVADINTAIPYNISSTNKPILQNKTKTAHELLLELDQEIQNEPSWYHSPKLDFIYEQLSPVPMQSDMEESKIQRNTEELLSEFDTVCNAVGLQLTPPATPPMSPSIITTASPVPEITPDYVTGAPIVYIVTLDNNTDITQEDITSPDMLIEEVLSEASDDSMDLIDELVREHTTNLPDDLTSIIDDTCSIADSQISDSASVVSSRGSDSSYAPSLPSDDTSSYASFMSPRSTDSFDVAGYDDEWTPSVDKKKTLKKSSSRSKAGEPKKEKRGYGRPLHEKKARKKEQNKNAATRYRQKKKELLQVVLSEEDQLLQVFNKLKTKHDDVKREIRYLKQLMKEILIAKGVLQ